MIINTIKAKPHPRTINWIYDPLGGIGKSQLCRYLEVKHQAHTFTTTKEGDVIYCLPRKTTTILFDLARQAENTINYRTIENIKNGHATSTKYEPRNKTFPIPHIWIFSNFFPDRTQLSNDRWNIFLVNPFARKEDESKVVAYENIDLDTVQLWKEEINRQLEPYRILLAKDKQLSDFSLSHTQPHGDVGGKRDQVFTYWNKKTNKWEKLEY